MATLSVIRKAFGDALRTIPKLVVAENLTEITTLGDGGCVVLGGPTADYTGAFGRGLITWNIPLQVLVPSSNYGRATELLDELVTPDGDRSIPDLVWDQGRAAMGGFGVLGSDGMADLDAKVSGLTAYGIEFPNAGVKHLAAVLTCVVLSSGKAT